MQGKKQIIDPAGFHVLRASFSKRLEYIGMPAAYIDYMQGHALPYNGAYRRPHHKKLLEKYKEFEQALSVSKAPKTVSELEENLKRELEKERAYAMSLEERIKKIESTQKDTDKIVDLVLEQILKDNKVISLIKNL